MPEDQTPECEYIADCFERTIPIYMQSVLPELVLGKSIVLAAQANSFSGFVRRVDGITAEKASTLAIPFVY